MNTTQQIPKSVIFAVVAAVGCLIAAVLAEPLFVKPPERYIPPTPPAPKFCLTFDDSGSMGGFKRDAVKQAAKEFVNKRDLDKEKIAIVVFSSGSQIFLQLSHDKNQVLQTIQNYSNGGGTYFAQALQDSYSVFQNDTETQSEELTLKEINAKIKEQNEKDKQHQRQREPLKEQSVQKIVLFFTDGENADSQEALNKATMLRENGVMLFAVATQDGNRNYLTQMTGDVARVFMTSDRNIADAFKQVEQEIAKITSTDSLLATKDKDGVVREEQSRNWILFQAIAWSALLCLGMALLIVLTQNKMLRKSLFEPIQFGTLAIGSIVGGIVAGYIGNSVFQFIPINFVGRLVGLVLLGSILAVGMSFYIPNLARFWALVGGAVGGFLGAIGFGISSAVVGDMSGRILGAIIIGTCIGAMIGWIESTFRNVWLMVMYDPRNFAQVNLGTQLVTVGSNNRNMIVIPNVEPFAGSFQVVGNTVQYKDAKGTRSLNPGDNVKIGHVELIVCSKDAVFAATKFYPMKMSRAKELQKQI
jgi:Ca-activated chloride channel family protein